MCVTCLLSQNTIRLTKDFEQSRHKATEHHPPNILALDQPHKKAKRTTASKTREINLNITHSIASPRQAPAPRNPSESLAGPSNPPSNQFETPSDCTTRTGRPPSTPKYPPVGPALEFISPNYEIELFHCVGALERAGYDRVDQVEEAGLEKLIN